jgi:mRNA deadenylase 3'-5' endonuclease subunit Ccr4
MADRGYAGIRQGPDHEVLLAVFFKVDHFSVSWCEQRSRALLVELELCGSRFEHQFRGEKLYLVNIHLEGKPDKPDVRVSQLRHALERLTRHIESTGASASEARLIVNGDFNSSVDDAPCQLLRWGKLEAGYTEPWLPEVIVTDHTIVHPFSLVNSYEVAGMELEFTHKEKGDVQSSVLDHIWVSGNKGSLEVKGVLDQMKGELLALAESQGLPNKEWPSDHVMVGCMVRIR